jgi:hypothetical protein
VDGNTATPGGAIAARSEFSTRPESPDPHFLPMTDLTVHWLSDASAIARFPFAMVNRHQLVTVMDESTLEAGQTAEPEGRRHKVASG